MGELASIFIELQRQRKTDFEIFMEFIHSDYRNAGFRDCDRRGMKLIVGNRRSGKTIRLIQQLLIDSLLDDRGMRHDFVVKGSWERHLLIEKIRTMMLDANAYSDSTYHKLLFPMTDIDQLNRSTEIVFMSNGHTVEFVRDSNDYQRGRRRSYIYADEYDNKLWSFLPTEDDVNYRLVTSRDADTTSRFFDEERIELPDYQDFGVPYQAMYENLRGLNTSMVQGIY